MGESNYGKAWIFKSHKTIRAMVRVYTAFCIKFKKINAKKRICAKKIKNLIEDP